MDGVIANYPNKLRTVVGLYMRQMGIRACWVKHYTVTTQSRCLDAILVNILQEQFNPPRPDTIWCSDITYIWTTEGFVYLASIMDLFSRKIIAWNLSRKLDASSIVRMIQMAKQTRNPGRLVVIHTTRNPGRLVVIHTDRGCQYLSQSYIKETAQMCRSYSKKGYPWDNACIESFHALIKREWLNRFKIALTLFIIPFEFRVTVTICHQMTMKNYMKTTRKRQL